MNWKDKWNQGVTDGMYDLDDVPDFISTEIIEKLIADLPDDMTETPTGGPWTRLKQQLRDKWL
jgi:hypothetical protein